MFFLILYDSIDSLPSHGSFNLGQRGENLLVMLPFPNNLETNRSPLVRVGVVEIVHKFVLLILGCVSSVLGIFGRVNCGDRKDSRGIIQKIPLCCIAPVTGVSMSRCCTKIRRAYNHVDLLPIILLAIPPRLGIPRTILISLTTQLKN